MQICTDIADCSSRAEFLEHARSYESRDVCLRLSCRSGLKRFVKLLVRNNFYVTCEIHQKKKNVKIPFEKVLNGLF